MEEFLQLFYQCGICQEPITYPKKLKCQHVFCHECLVIYITEYFGKASFPCPVCHYKHFPEEQETLINQNTLLILEEDSLMRDVRRFYKDGEEPQPIYTSDGINRVPCTIHNDSMCGYFCPDCAVLVCTQCKQEMHSYCPVRQIDKNMHIDSYNNILEVNTNLTKFLRQTEIVHNDLNRKAGNIFNNSPERIETIKLYYSDLKEKVVKYLEEQEREVLEKALHHEEQEKAHLENDVGVCSMMASSIELRQQLAQVVLERSSTNAGENMVIGNHLRNDFENFKQMLSQLQSDVNTDYNVRFIINTELEDKLTNTDIVQIEVIDSCHSDALAVTFEEEGVDHQPVSAQSPTVSPRSTLTRQYAQEGAVSSNSNDEDEPPPSYINVARRSFIQRPRSFSSSIVRRQESAHAHPPLNDQDSHAPSARPRPSAPYPTFDRQSYPSPYPQVPPLQPSAPPLSVAAFSCPTDIQYQPPPCPLAPIPPGAKTITMFKFRSDINTTTTTDTSVPSLVGISALGEFFVVVDKRNCCLKRVMIDSMNIVDQYRFERRMVPWDVAGVTETLCVVTVPEDGKLLFVNFFNTPGGPPPSLQRTMKSGKYLSIGYCKSNQKLIGGRGPPFSAARIDVVNMQGNILYYIDLNSAVAVPTCLTITESEFLAVCDVRNHKVIICDIFHPNKDPEVLRRHAFHSLKDPQGIALLPLMKSFLILDALSGDVFQTSHSGYMRKCLKGDIRIERHSNAAIKYTISVSTDQRILGVADNKGTVSFYEIRYM